MDLKTWPERDRKWVARYRTSIAGKHVPAAVLEEREGELLDAARAAGLPAAELFGDAAALAAEDAAELATVDEAVRTSDGGGLRTALREVGGTLVAFGGIWVLGAFLRSGWYVDVEVDGALVAASVTAVFVGWVVARAFFSAGRQVWTAGVLVAVVTLAVAGIASAVTLYSGLVAATDVPVPLLGACLLTPGVVVLVAVSRMPQQTLRRDWDDSEWLRRFRGGLRSRLVPAATAQGHVAEVEHALRSGAVSASGEFGHPLVLARELAEADRTARARRWWVVTVAGTGAPLLIALLIFWNDSWGALTVPLGVLFLLGALLRPVLAWDERPWAKRR